MTGLMAIVRPGVAASGQSQTWCAGARGILRVSPGCGELHGQSLPCVASEVEAHGFAQSRRGGPCVECQAGQFQSADHMQPSSQVSYGRYKYTDCHPTVYQLHPIVSFLKSFAKRTWRVCLTRYVETGAEPYVNIINIGEPNLTAPEGECLSPGEELSQIIVVTAPHPQTSHMDRTPAASRNITGIIFVQNGQKCILGRRRGMRHSFAPPYRFKLLGVWGRASQHITEIGFLVEPLRRPEKWECGTFSLPSYAHGVGRGDREIECAGGCSHGSKFLHSSEAGIAALHVYGRCVYGCEGGEVITSLQFRFFDSSKQHVIGEDISSSVLKVCQLFFEPGEATYLGAVFDF